MKTHDVKHLVARYVKKFETRDPFELAEHLNVEVQTGPMGSRSGCYMSVYYTHMTLHTITDV